MTKREKLISVAEGELGYKENPPNSNSNKYGEWYGLNYVAWCAIFVSWVYKNAGVPLGRIDNINGFQYCPSALAYWRKNDKITIQPAMGDIVMFDWETDKKADHVGIFVKWIIKNKTFETIEGNTSGGSDSDGGQVQRRRQRKVSQVIAFVNPLDIEFP